MDDSTLDAGDRPVSALGRPSVKLLMFLLALAVLVPAGAVAAWFLSAQLEQARAAAEGKVRVLVDSTAAALQLTLKDYQSVMQRLAERPGVAALDPDRFDPGVAEYIRLHPEFNTLTVRDREARLVFSSRPNPNTQQEFAAFPWFKEGIASAGFVAGDAFKGTLTGRWVTVLTYPIRNQAGEVAGLMSLSLDLLALNQRLLGSVTSNALVAVLDRQDRYLLRSGDPQTWLGQLPPAKALDLIRGQREGTASTTGAEGVRRLYAFGTIADTGWRVFAGVPEEEVFAPYRAMLGRGIAVGLGIMLISLLAAWRIGRGIVGPIDALARAAKRVAGGDRHALAPVEGPAEVQAVARQFNRMVQARVADEEMLRNSENSLAITLQSIGDAVIATDLAGRVTRMNPTAERLTGWALVDAVGRPLAEVFRTINSDTGEPAVDPVQRVLSSGTVVSLANHTALVARDGAQYQVADSAAPIRDSAGQTVGVVLVFSDISHSMQAQAAQRDLEKQVRESQKMESIGTLAGGIAHDFNNTLGAILGNLALARGDLGPGHPALQSLEQINRVSLRARRLVQQILAFSRREPQVLVAQPLQPIVHETLTLLRSGMPAMIELDTQLAAEPICVKADATQIQQVLLNLGTNAWHALAGKTGRIEFGLEACQFDAALDQTLGALPAGRYAHLWVRDTGIGMDEATRARVFEPFFTTKEVGGGTGLGLSVVHGIVKAHGGGIKLTSAVGRGTTVDLYLPVCESAQVDGLPGSPIASGAVRGHGEHVLYVDDDDVMRQLAQRLLERAGWRVTAAASVGEALELLQSAPQSINLVVTDFSMPVSSGLELAEHLARLRPELPVVITSGYISDELRCGAERLGVRHVMPKENLFEELVPLVQQALSEHRGVPAE